MTAATFWLLITIAALVWYSCVTVYVSIKGVSDIKNMLKRLSDMSKNDDGTKPP